MPENDFEKQVQHKMDEFRLRPSAPVWEKIKDDLNERKRRRFFIMVSLLAASMLLGWVGYNYFYTGNKIKNNQNETAVKNNNSIESSIGNEKGNSPETTNELEKQQTIKKQEVDLTNITDSKKNKKEANTGIDNSGKETTTDKTSLPARNEKLQLKKNAVAKLKSPQILITKKIARVKKEKNPNLEFEKNDNKINDLQSINNKQAGEIKAISANEEDITTAIQLKKDETPASLSDVTAVDFSGTIAANNTPLITVPAIAAPVPLKFSRKIKWGLSVAGGAASRAKEPFDFFSSTSTEKNLMDINVGFWQGNITGGVLVLPPSDVKPGLAFKAGFVLEKPLSKKVTVSSGLQYAYSSDHITVGKSISTSSNNLFADRFYSVAQSQAAAPGQGNPGMETMNYTNKYHFIELPLQVQYTINKKWKNPLVWNAGASVSRLIAADALLYDVAYGGVYYDAKNDLRKTQFNVFTGFAFRFTVNRLQWSVGPQVSINTSKLFENSYDNNRHPVFGGLNVRLIFPGKKK